MIVATIMTLLVLPSVFAVAQARAGRDSASLAPTDPQSRYYRDSFDAERRFDESDEALADRPPGPPAAQTETHQ
jgi:hypothetical protein